MAGQLDVGWLDGWPCQPCRPIYWLADYQTITSNFGNMPCTELQHAMYGAVAASYLPYVLSVQATGCKLDSLLNSCSLTSFLNALTMQAVQKAIEFKSMQRHIVDAVDLYVEMYQQDSLGSAQHLSLEGTIVKDHLMTSTGL